MNAKQTAVVGSVRAGSSIDEAAVKAGVNVHTLRRWLSTGRKHPDGPYGPFAALVDRLKEAPRGPTEYARSVVLAYGAFARDPSDDNGRRVAAVLRAIPPNDESKVMVDLAQHFLYAVMRQMNTGATAGDVDQACEEAFQEVDELNVVLERKYGN
jgi:transposase-like protein